MNTWQDFINEELKKTYLKSILSHVTERRKQGINIYPKDSHVFEAFNSCPFEQVKIVLIGQDPYHGANQAHGLSFSVLPGEKIPPSLKNIYKELQTDIDEFEVPDHGYLKSWAKQGVLLLNTVLTVEQGEAHSHAKLGWERFTEKAIEKISTERANVIFLLWGAHAQKKSKLIDQTKHVIFSAPHPSPLSVYRGFYGCKHFSKSNEQLVKWALTPINWQLPAIQTSLFS